jgi:hypothetical protein
MALVSGNGSSSLANPSQMSFALSSLVSVIEEQLEALGDDELALNQPVLTISQQPLESPVWWWYEGRMLWLWRSRPLRCLLP